MGQCCVSSSTDVSVMKNNSKKDMEDHNVDEIKNNDSCQRVIIFSVNHASKSRLMYQLLKFHGTQDTSLVLNYYQNYFKDLLWRLTVFMGRYLETILNPDELGETLNYLIKMSPNIHAKFSHDQITAIMQLWSYKHSLYFLFKLIDNIHQGMIGYHRFNLNSTENSFTSRCVMVKESYSFTGDVIESKEHSKERQSPGRQETVVEFEECSSTRQTPVHRLKKYVEPRPEYYSSLMVDDEIPGVPVNNELNGNRLDEFNDSMFHDTDNISKHPTGSSGIDQRSTLEHPKCGTADLRSMITKTHLDFLGIHDDYDELQKSISRIKEEYIDEEMINFFMTQSKCSLTNVVERRENIIRNIIPSIDDIINYHAPTTGEKEFEMNAGNTKYIFIGASDNRPNQYKAPRNVNLGS